MVGMGQFKYWLGKIQVPTEPGLSTAQLMLTNDDLEPGMDRRISILSSPIPPFTLLPLEHPSLLAGIQLSGTSEHY